MHKKKKERKIKNNKEKENKKQKNKKLCVCKWQYFLLKIIVKIFVNKVCLSYLQTMIQTLIM